MNKFWKWMKEKGYGRINKLDSCTFYVLIDKEGCEGVPTDQMLVGPMIEYIRIHRLWELKKEALIIYEKLLKLWTNKDIYQELEDIIKLIDQE